MIIESLPDIEFSRCIAKIYVRSLSIEEIKQYLANPGIDTFMQIADYKIKELNEAAEKLEKTKHILEKKKQQLEFCKTITPGEIKIIDRDDEYLISTLFSSSQNKIHEMMVHLKTVWDIEQYKVGCGSFISLEKIREKKFETYDGVYTPMTYFPAGILTDGDGSRC